MGLLPDTKNFGLRMRRECRERFPRPRLKRKPLVSDPDMLHGTCITHVPWCMSGSLTRSGGGNIPGIPCACATLNFTYLARGPCPCCSLCWLRRLSCLWWRMLCISWTILGIFFIFSDDISSHRRYASLWKYILHFRIFSHFTFHIIVHIVCFAHLFLFLHLYFFL